MGISLNGLVMRLFILVSEALLKLVLITDMSKRKIAVTQTFLTKMYDPRF